MKLWDWLKSGVTKNVYTEVIEIPNNVGWLVRVIYDGNVEYLDCELPKHFAFHGDAYVYKNCIFLTKPCEEDVKDWVDCYVKGERTVVAKKREVRKEIEDVRKVL